MKAESFQQNHKSYLNSKNSLSGKSHKLHQNLQYFIVSIFPFLFLLYEISF